MVPNMKKRQASGGRRLVASGRRPVTLGILPEDHDLLRQAAEIDRRPLTQFLIYHGLVTARKILEKSGKTT